MWVTAIALVSYYYGIIYLFIILCCADISSRESVIYCIRGYSFAPTPNSAIPTNDLCVECPINGDVPPGQESMGGRHKNLGELRKYYYVLIILY